MEPTRGRRKREEMCTAHGGSLYVLRLAISVRYIAPVRMPITAVTVDVQGWLMASYVPKVSIALRRYDMIAPETRECKEISCWLR